MVSMGEDMEQREVYYTAWKNVNWHDHSREQFGNKYKCWRCAQCMIQQFHFWGYAIKETLAHAPGDGENFQSSIVYEREKQINKINQKQPKQPKYLSVPG